MASITNYTGEKDLGIGINANISVVSPEGRSNSVIDDTTNKIMERNHANNVSMFKQKVDDRDKLYQALADGQIKVGDIDPSDREYYEKSKKSQMEAFDNMSQNGGITNKDAYRKYVESTTNLNQSVTHVQARKVMIDQYKAQIAAEPIPAKRKIIEDQLKKQLDKGSGALIDPHQNVSDWNGDKHLATGLKDAIVGGSGNNSSTSQTVSTKSTPGKPSTTTTTTKTAPAKGKQPQSVTTSDNSAKGSQGGNDPQSGSIVYRNGIPMQVSHQYVDFNKIKSNYRDDFMETTGAGADLQNKLYESLTNPDIISHPEIRETYDEMIKKSEEYNHARGFKMQEDGTMSKEDLDNGAADIQKLRKAIASPIDPKTGKRNINMSISELSAYYTLAHNTTGYASTSETEMKDLFEGQLKLKESNAKIGAENALTNFRRANTRLVGKKTSLLDKQANIPQTFDELGVQVKGYEQLGKNFSAINSSQMSQKFLDNLGIAPIDDKGNYNIEVANFRNGKTNKPYSADELQEAFTGWLKHSPQAKELSEQLGRYPNVIDFAYIYGSKEKPFKVQVVGKVLPIYKTVTDPLTKETKTIIVNEKESKRLVRSDKLNSLINQTGDMTKLQAGLMKESESEGGQ